MYEIFMEKSYNFISCNHANQYIFYILDSLATLLAHKTSQSNLMWAEFLSFSDLSKSEVLPIGHIYIISISCSQSNVLVAGQIMSFNQVLNEKGSVAFG